MGIFLLLGSNQGDRQAILFEAGRMINERIGHLVRSSSVYATKAWGITQQPDFLNQVIQVSTTLSPGEVLMATQEIERMLGRKKAEKWGPRVIDIDLLYYNEQVIDTEGLTVPHPQIQNRRFTLAPLAEIAPQLIHPLTGKTQHQLLQECPDPLGVTKVPAAANQA